MTGQSSTVRYSNRQLQRARELLTRLDAARRAARFYPQAHPVSQETVAGLFDAIRVYHREDVDVVLTFVDGEVLLGEQILPEESVLFDGLIRDIASAGGVTVQFLRGLNPTDVHVFVRCITENGEAIASRGGLARMLEEAGAGHVRVEAVSVVGDQYADDSAAGVYADAVTLVHEVDRQVFTGWAPDARKTTRVVRSLVDNVLLDRSAMLRLTGLHEYDQYTFYHSANVAVLAVALGSMISQEHRFLSILGVAGLLHDIGKLALPKEIVNKPGALTLDEWAEMKAHPVIGAQMVASMRGIDKAAVVAVLEHHQRYDGSGYPGQLLERPQHLASRIIALADAYDAMTSRRSYSAARMNDRALSIIASSAGTSFDPVLVRLLARMLGVYPPRSVVRLSDDRLAIVLSPGANNAEEPVVRVVADPDAWLIEPYDLELEDTHDITVRETVDPRLLNIEVDDYV